MGDLLQNLWGPQSEFQAPPPSMMELALRAAGGLLPPPGQLKVAPTGLGRFLGGATRIGGTLGGIVGEEMAKRRLAPENWAFPLAERAMAELKGVRVPTEVNVPRETFPVFPYPEEGNEPVASTYEFPGATLTGPTITRPARNLPEAMAYSSPETRQRAMIGMKAGLPPSLFFQEPEKVTFADPSTVPSDVFTGKPVGPQLPRQPTGAEQMAAQSLQAQAVFNRLVTNRVQAGQSRTRHDAEVEIANQFPELVPFLLDSVQSRIGKEPTLTEFDKKRDVVSKDLYNTRFSELTDPKQQVKVDQEVSRRYKEAPQISILTSAAAAQTNLPVTPKEAGFWLDKWGQQIPQNKVIGRTPGELLAQGGRRAIDASEVRILRPVQGMYTQIDKMEHAMSKLLISRPKDPNLFAQLAQQTQNRVVADLLRRSGDPMAAQYAASYAILLPNLARIIEQIPGGRLSLGLFNLEGSQLPNPATDSKESARLKFAMMRDRLQDSTGVGQKLPSGIPDGSILIGWTKTGERIYKTPDNQKLVE